MSSTNLLTLPREIRDHIWSFSFQDITITPFSNQNRDWFFYPARRQCHACPGTESSDLPSTKEIFSSLLACKQLYHEAYPVLQSSMCLHIGKPGELEDIRQSSRETLRSKLRFLKLVIHLNDSSREQWRDELCNLPNIFPSLESLDIFDHMRPPINFQNLSDAIYFASPIVHFPPNMVPRLHFAYIEDDEMFTLEEHGTIYYHDALEAHGLVIQSLMADSEFQDYSRNFVLEPMIARLMVITQSYEASWLESLRQRRTQESSGANTSGMQA
jgi:hypothetical protein